MLVMEPKMKKNSATPRDKTAIVARLHSMPRKIYQALIAIPNATLLTRKQMIFITLLFLTKNATIALAVIIPKAISIVTSKEEKNGFVITHTADVRSRNTSAAIDDKVAFFIKNLS